MVETKLSLSSTNLGKALWLALPYPQLKKCLDVRLTLSVEGRLPSYTPLRPNTGQAKKLQALKLVDGRPASYVYDPAFTVTYVLRHSRALKNPV